MFYDEHIKDFHKWVWSVLDAYDWGLVETTADKRIWEKTPKSNLHDKQR